MRAYRLLAGLLPVLLTPIIPAAAQDRSDFQRLYLSPEVAYVLPTDGDVNDSYFVGGRVGLNFDQNWALEVESGWMELGIDAGRDNLDVETIPILANLRFNTDKQEWGSVYVFGGAGASINHLSGAGDTEVEVDDSFIWQVGLGADTPVNDAIDIFLDVRYFANEPDISETGPITQAALPSDANLQAVLFTTGIEF